MRTLRTFLASSAVLALAACGGGGGGIGPSVGEVFRAQPSNSLLIDPKAVDYALRGDTSEHTASNVQGATGVIATATFLDPSPVLREVYIRLNSDRTELTLQVQGWAPIVLPVDGSASEFSGSYGEFFGEFVTLSHFDDMGRMTYSNATNPISSINGFGHYGLETPLDRLPTTTATYDGRFDASGYVSSFSAPTGVGADANFSMVLDFTDSTISGTTRDGQIFYSDGMSSLQRDTATGGVSGSISGNGISGSFTLSGASSSANLVFKGNMYGWDYDQVGGALIGTVTGGGGTNPVFGEFDGRLD